LGNLDIATAILDQAASRADDNRRKQISRVKRYLNNNADGLGEGPSLGVIEPNVDKLAANRMKKRGMAWTKIGARRMLKLLKRRACGNFDNLLNLKTQIGLVAKLQYKHYLLCKQPVIWYNFFKRIP